MKKYYVAANILGAVEVRAESAEEAHAKASHFLSKRFQLQAKPTGLWVFEKNDTNMTATAFPSPAPDAGSGTGA